MTAVRRILVAVAAAAWIAAGAWIIPASGASLLVATVALPQVEAFVCMPPPPLASGLIPCL